MAILTLRNVKSYSADKDVNIDLSKPVTLIYGQNGAGKSTISSFFSGFQQEKYQHCHFASRENFAYFVFNQEYIEQKFHQEIYQPGIFTLNEKNDDVNGKIESNKRRITEINNLLNTLDTEIKNKNDAKSTVIEKYSKVIFKKTINDRQSLDYFLDRAKRVNNFYQKMRETSLGIQKYELVQLTERLELLLNSEGTQYTEIIEPEVYGLSDEMLTLLQSSLTASSDTPFSAIIQQLGNADWVHSGTGYIKDNICPFCQQKFDSQHLLHELTLIFDKSYEDALATLTHSQTVISHELDLLESFHEHLRQHPVVSDDHQVFSIIKSLQQTLRNNLQSLRQKLLQPSQSIQPDVITDIRQHLNQILVTLNSNIRDNNQLAANFSQERARLAADSFAYLREVSDPYLRQCDQELAEIQQQLQAEINQVDLLRDEERALSVETTHLIGQLSVIQPTIDNINYNLTQLGINDFNIICHDESLKLYRLHRQNQPDDSEVFKSLSEGEKTIISLLYFLESCIGHVPDSQTIQPKLIVIDDPISSLSHNYIYEVASMIKHKLILPKIAQHIVILTHNIFFFQEILLSVYKRLAPERTTPKGCALYRIIKGEYSDCIPLSMHDMLNEYQALWQTIRDVRDGRSLPVVLPNTMRNILEYYFSFSCKQEKLDKALNKLAVEYSAGEYDSFYRAINRHSHSDGRNIMATGVINVEMYFRLFQKIFEETKDSDHYNTMMGITVEQTEG
ncbi:TPA: AAA family ATPase [Proteus mirabilis]|uniref:AAA family ATPase n=3 Tax=Proteus TaxID=583 RepID=UPI0018C455FB|nr:AAA family ATPase [Proteus mirabilis]EJD6328670.1 AAA family ATPase [Proteus mirabilis]EJD6391358.1 AAA family ATPase [Proteus mirabilis]EKV7659684.1 AAA family ATPase [Proteus mirabilis]MBG2797248.1 AAA family ATPase [Proteus mirabilis]MBG2987008.1 AAA family ATPase [Proteus mirabilis]